MCRDEGRKVQSFSTKKKKMIIRSEKEIGGQNEKSTLQFTSWIILGKLVDCRQL